MCSQRGKEKIVPGEVPGIPGMYDLEKWASDYVEVRGNYQYPLREYGRLEVPTRSGEPSKHRLVVFFFIVIRH